MSDIYKKGTRENVTFQTSDGVKSISQMWEIKKAVDMEPLLIDLSNQIKKVVGDSELTFLRGSKNKVNPILQLKYDILKDIYLTKITEEDNSILASAKKKELQGFLAIKEDRQKDANKNLSNAELEAKIAALSS